MFSNTNLLASAALLSLAGAVTHVVDVGKNGLAFTPNSTAAGIGDIVEFHYFPKDHSVVQTSFGAPCQFNLTNPFFSGFMPTSSGEAPKVFQVKINTTSPIWFYCSQANHCQSGMVGVINEPPSGNTLTVFAANAAKAGNSTTPANIAGGVFAANTNSNSTSTGSASSSTPTGVYGNPTTSGTAAATASSTSSNTSSTSSSPTAISGAVAMQAVRWSELLGMAVVIGGAAIVML